MIRRQTEVQIPVQDPFPKAMAHFHLIFGDDLAHVSGPHPPHPLIAEDPIYFYVTLAPVQKLGFR